MRVPLTSDWVLGPGWAGSQGGLALYADPATGRLWHRAVNPEGLDRAAEVRLRAGLQEEFAAHLLLLSGPGPAAQDFGAAPDGERAQAAWWCLWLAEQARRAAADGNWEKVGEKVDLVWGRERAFLEPGGWDLLYAGLRVAGAYGGRFHAGGAALLVPPGKRAAVAEALAGHAGWGVAG